MTERAEITYEVINDSDVEVIPPSTSQESVEAQPPAEEAEAAPKQRKGGKIKKDMRTRKEYMRDYYHKTRKVGTVCGGCNCTFVCKSSMRHHEETNWLCLLTRMTSMWERVMTHEPPQACLPELEPDIKRNATEHANSSQGASVKIKPKNRRSAKRLKEIISIL